ncbi:MAG TPA: hypothetical protein VHM91_02085, partial [Verrucomicrobiales bacterium]|nr:hypothetical protein [Verrucomicrobiales bacterium]
MRRLVAGSGKYRRRYRNGVSSIASLWRNLHIPSMPQVLPFPGRRRRRTVWLAAASAVTGSVLQLVMQPSPAPQAGEMAAAATAASGSKPPVTDTGKTPGGMAPARALTMKDLLSLSDVDRFAAVMAALPGMPVKEIAPLVDGLGASLEAAPTDPFTETSAVPALLRMLLLRWAELDAPGMLAALEAPAFSYRCGTRVLAVCVCAELRGVEALEEARGRWPWAAHAAAWEMMYRHPEQLEALLPSISGLLTGAHGSPESVCELLGPERVFRLASVLGRDWTRSIAQTVAETDFPAALEELKGMPPGHLRDEALAEFLAGSSDPFSTYGLEPLDEARQAVLRTEYEALPPGYARDMLARRYAEVRAKEDPEAAVTWARTLPDKELRASALRIISENLAEDSGEAKATQYHAEAWLADAGRTEELAAHFINWHLADPPAADAWLRTVTSPDLRSILEPKLLEAPGTSLTVLSASAQRMEYAQKALAEEELVDGVRPYYGPGIPAEWRAALRLYSLGAEGVSDEAWAGAGTGDRRILAEQAIQSRLGDDLFPKMDDAREFFESFSPAERSLGAWYQGGRMKIMEDLTGASEWMAALPQGPERDAAATALVEYLTGAAEAGRIELYRNVLQPFPESEVSEHDPE